MGFGLNPGLRARPRRNSLLTGEKRTVRKKPGNVADTGEGAADRCCQKNHGAELGQKRIGSPKTMVSNRLSILIRRAFGLAPKTDTDPNTRMENFVGVTFSMVLTKTGFSEMRSFVRESRLAESRCRMAPHPGHVSNFSQQF